MKKQKLLSFSTSDWFWRAVMAWNKSHLKKSHFSPSTLKRAQTRCQMGRLQCRCLLIEEDESQLRMSPQPQALFYSTGGKSCINQAGRDEVFVSLTDRGSFQSIAVVISSNNAGKAISQLVACFLVKLKSCGFADKTYGKMDVCSASALLFCFCLKKNK